MKVFLIALLISANLIDYSASKCPNGVNAYGMSDKSRTNILFWHKHYRNQLLEGVIANLPMAKEMPEMIYDDELETEAQYFANHCHFEYENVTTRTYGQVGLNLFIQVTKEFDRREEWAQVIYEWWNEQDMYYYGKLVVPQARHFGQMIWAKTKYIGCGFTIFPIKHPPKTLLYHKFYVCAYAPRGNILGELPYESVTTGKL